MGIFGPRESLELSVDFRWNHVSSACKIMLSFINEYILRYTRIMRYDIFLFFFLNSKLSNRAFASSCSKLETIRQGPFVLRTGISNEFSCHPVNSYERRLQPSRSCRFSEDIDFHGAKGKNGTRRERVNFRWEGWSIHRTVVVYSDSISPIVRHGAVQRSYPRLPLLPQGSNVNRFKGHIDRPTFTQPSYCLAAANRWTSCFCTCILYRNTGFTGVSRTLTSTHGRQIEWILDEWKHACPSKKIDSIVLHTTLLYSVINL